MDVAEASKHGKKSTSQKLEDQKKVGYIFFGYSLNIGLFNCLLCIWVLQLLSFGLLLPFFMHLLAKGMVNWLGVQLT